MRLMFVARAIDRMAGGVERMIKIVMNALAARGHEVNLLTWDLANAEAFLDRDLTSPVVISQRSGGDLLRPESCW